LALEKGEEEADICVAPFDDHTMVRAYITENATQRGNTATAITGAVATAIVQLAKALILDDREVVEICATSRESIAAAKEQSMEGEGIPSAY
jgi:hypothetical protein